MEILINKKLLENLDAREKAIIQFQRGLLIAGYILCLPLIWLSMQFFHTMLFGAVAAAIPIFIISLSSIISRISIFKMRWHKELPKGKQAVLAALLMIISEIIMIILFIRFLPLE